MQMKDMIRKKMEDCWRKFCEEHGKREAWDVIRWAKDRLRLKERMEELKNMDRRVLSSD